MLHDVPHPGQLLIVFPQQHNTRRFSSYMLTTHSVSLQFGDELEVGGVRDPSMKNQHFLVDDGCQGQPAEYLLEQFEDLLPMNLRFPNDKKV